MGLAIFVLGLLNFFFRGFVFMTVWNWFPAEILNAPVLNFTSALGLLLIVLFFKPITLKSKKQINEEKLTITTEERFTNVFAVTSIHALILLAAWIITLFI